VGPDVVVDVLFEEVGLLLEPQPVAPNARLIAIEIKIKNEDLELAKL
jgi:hypothetical protein